MTVATTVNLTQHFTTLVKTPEKYAADAQKFVDAFEKAGQAQMTATQKIVGSHMLQDLENSAEHFVYAAVTMHFAEDMHRQIEEKAEQVYKTAERLRSILSQG